MGVTAAEAGARRKGQRNLAAVLSILCCAAIGYAWIYTQPRLLADEGFHAPQIWSFFWGHGEVSRHLTTLPTYHAILAAAERVIGLHDDRLLRLLNLCGGLALPYFLWRLVALHSPEEAGRRTLQWFVMPLLFPFFFLVYTDVWALAAVVAVQYWALRGNHLLAGLAGFFAIALRLDAVIWVALAWALVVARDVEFSTTLRRRWRELLVPAMLRGLPLAMPLALFVAYYVWNGGVAAGDADKHEVGFNLTNVAVFLMCAWAVFLPMCLAAMPRILPLLRRPIWLAVLIAGFVLYMGTYANDHQYNGPGLRFYLHNEGLYWLTRYPALRALAYVPVAWVVLAVATMRLPEKRLYLFFAVAILAAGLHPLIEQRYYLPALTLFQAWRPRAASGIERASLAIYCLATPVIMWGIVNERFFL